MRVYHIVDLGNKELRSQIRGKPLVLLAAAGLAVVLAAGCTQSTSAPTSAPSAAQETPKSGGILDVAFDVAEPAHLDPLKGGSYLFTNLVGKEYNGLLQYDPIENTKIIPDMAERWEVSQDGKTYTFFLHKGVKWHDGVAFSAQDVKFTLDRLRDRNDRDAANFAAFRDLLSPIDRVDVVDDSTVRLNLTRPSNSLLSAFAYGTMLITPKHAFDQGIDLGKTVIGTGPFKLSEYVRGSIFRVVKNPDYFIKDRPYLDGLDIYLLKDTATRVAAFTTGQIKLLSYIYKPDVDSIKKDVPQAVVSAKSGLRNGFIGFENQKPPFNDVRVRRAVDLALDRQTALKVLLEEEGTIGTLLAPEISSFTLGELARTPGYRVDKTQDLAEAKRLLAEAGYPNGFSADILTSAASKDYSDLAVYAKDQLRNIGINTTIRVAPQADYANARIQGDFQIAAVVGVLYFPDPSAGTTYYGRGNFMKFSDQQFFNLLDQQDAAPTPEARKNLVRQMEQRWMDVAPYSVVYWKTHSAVMYPEVHGYEVGVGIYNNHRFQDVWLSR